jgi:transcriptional regulator with XRE-family HTH domain
VSKLQNRGYYKALGMRIAQLRKEQSMTQAELARILGVSQQTVFAYELGERRVAVSLLPLLVKTLAIPVQELIGLAPPGRVKRQRLSPKIIRQVERIQQLPKAEQRFVVRLIDSLATRYNL